MALQELVRIAVRPRCELFGALVMAVALTAVGCGHSRQSYRPVYTTPAPASSPCTNCGSSSAVTTSESNLAPVTSAPPISESSTIESTVPTLPSAARPRNGSSRASVLESTPKASIGGEPEFDDTALPTTGQRSNGSSQSTKKSAADQIPRFQGPTPPATPAPAAWNTNKGTEALVSASTSKVVRRTGLTERLRPFVDESGANALVYPDKADRPWKYIVLHHSATADGSYDQIDGEHRKVLGFDGCGYHFVIGNGTGSGDGQIEIARRWSSQKQGLHCRNARTHDVDEYGIGICMVGDFDQQPPTPRQIQAAQALVAYLGERYKISPPRVTTHVQLAATPTVCPGKYFPTESIMPATRGAAQSTPVRATWRVVRDSSKTY